VRIVVVLPFRDAFPPELPKQRGLESPDGAGPQTFMGFLTSKIGSEELHPSVSTGHPVAAKT
jgi:hypothetical protein